MPGTYRKARSLPHNIKDHVTLTLEERLYPQALSLLENTLVAGNGTAARDAYVPSSHIIALIATLAVHPKLTTRTLDKELHAVADDSIRYLLELSIQLGPVDCLKSAFHFDSMRTFRLNKRRSIEDIDNAVESERVRSKYADDESLFSGRHDFWSVVGWSFNCSLLYKARWMRWSKLLDVMLTVLESDLDQYLSDCETNAIDPDDDPKKTLLMRYLGEPGECRVHRRRIIRAILADGSEQYRSEFGEIWKNETKLPRTAATEPKKKRRKLDIEHGEYGDYDAGSDDADSPIDEAGVDSSKLLQDHETQNGNEDAKIEILGGTESLALRKRFFKLLIKFCAAMPDAFLDEQGLIDLYVESFRDFTLQQFQQLLLDLGHDSRTQMRLYVRMLDQLTDTDEMADDGGNISQTDFETHYLRHAARNADIVENAKLGLLLEVQMRSLWKSGKLTPSKSLSGAVRTGVTAREARAKGDGRKNSAQPSKDDMYNMTALQTSGQRMLSMLDWLQDKSSAS